MESEETKPRSGDTSLDSKGSGGSQKSMLELLTITDAAVKALNKSAGSQGSGKSQRVNQSIHSNGSQASGRSQKSDQTARSVQSGKSDTKIAGSLVVSQPNNDRAIRSEQTDQLPSDRSDKSVHSRLSEVSIRSHQSGVSNRSGQSGMSARSGRSVQSQSSSRSVGDVKVTQPTSDVSRDSGVISKTHTTSEKSKSRGATLVSPTDDTLHERSSDESTTASDVLIRSTFDKSDRSILAEAQNGNNGSSSGSSKCSKTSFGVENFNSTGPQKVKISRKHLREIKPPFEDSSPRSSASSDGKVPSALLNGTGALISHKNGQQIDVVTSSNDSNGDKFPQRSFPRGAEGSEQFKVEKVRKSADKVYEDINMVPKTKPRTNGHIQNDDKFEKNPQPSAGSSRSCDSRLKADVKKPQSVTADKISEPSMQFRSTPKYYVERHTPQKSQTRTDNNGLGDDIPERKNLLQDLEDSVEIVTAHAQDTSGSSSQPEIVTVPERIVTISAQNSLSPASSVGDLVTKTTPPAVTFHSASHKLRDDRGRLDSDSKKSLDESGSIPPALSRPHTDDDDDSLKKMETRPNPARFQLYSRQTTGHGLQQGAPVSGSVAPYKQRDEDIHISDFKLSDKQKMAKESFARRQGGPIRRIVQARIVGHDKPGTMIGAEEKTQQPSLGQANDQVLTAAAAASAAVAATQPFLKAQQEMELKMAEVLAKISELQSAGSLKTGGFGSRSEHDSERVRQLEKQLGDMTEKRIEYMERLQEQQIAMQAKLLSMTRDAPAHSQPYQPRSYSPDTHLTSGQTSNRAFSKTTVAKQPTKGDYSKLKHSALDLDHDVSTSPLDTPAPRARAPKPTMYDTSDIEYRVGRSRSPKGKSPKARSRSPKAKSPKARSRSPTKDKADRGILHQILASVVDSPSREINRPPQPVTASSRITDSGESPNVRKAKHLIDDLNHIKHQVQDLVEDKENWKASRKETDVQDTNQINTSHTEPFPLDSYLSIPDHADISPYKSLPDLSSSKFNAPVLPGFKDAESILHQVQQNRGYLESNFEAVLRARQEVEVYSMLEAVYNDSTDHEKCRIKQMVDKSIQKLRREVEREVTDDMVISAVQKKGSAVVPGAVKMPEPVPTSKMASRPGIRGRLSQPKVEPKVEAKKPVTKRPGGPTKEPFQHKFYRPPPKRKSVFEDEEAMTRIYGKASYQKGRTTVKDPYLHFQNTAKHKPSRQNVQGDVKGIGKEMMSSKTQTSTGGVRQFYFNPSTGSYIPIASVANTAPIPGQLISMAVPLGDPRMNPGVMIPSSTPGIAVGSKVPLVSAEGNVSMVSVGVDMEDSKLKPELGKQVLPAVDIDTDISELSEIMEEPPVAMQTIRTPEAKRKKRVQIVSPRDTPNKTGRKSPSKAHYEVMFHEDSEGTDNSDPEIVQDEGSITISQPAISHSVSNDHSDDTLVEDEDVETGTGLEFPGYQPEEIPEDPYNGPTFPPKLPSADRQLTSDLIAEDIKRRDLLQNKATEWIEQELMARIITEVYPLKDVEEPQDISHVVSEGSEDSMAEEKEKSMFVMDTIGHRGMQLFVDAGRPVDNTMVNKLVEEVLLEKIRTMLGQRPDAEDLRQPIKPEEQQWEEPVSEELEPPPVQQSTVRTPEPTPRASPRSSPPRRISPARTPIASPPATSPRLVHEMIEPMTPPPVIQQPVILPAEPESEPESSASYDIKEELDRLADKLRPNINASASIHSRHDVGTPPESPKPEPEPVMQARPLTPPQLSPRQVIEEPFMMTQSVAPAGTSMEHSPTRMARNSKSESATSPQVTDLAEEELAEDQPKAVVFTVAETQTDVSPEPRPKSRSPSPDKTRSRTPSESSYTESSSISESFNECVSEGQWLINKSDGEVADFPIDEVAVRDRMLRMNRKRVDVSSASTWKDTEDVDLDEMTDVSRSEGEFLYKTEFPPEKDPVLDMLARLQSAGPNYGLYQMSHGQVTDVLNTTGKSEGEVIRVSSVGLPQQQQQFRQQQQYQQQQQQYVPERDLNHASPKRSKSPTSRSQGVASGKRGMSPRKEGASHHRSKSPVYRAQSPTRVSFEGDLNDQQRPVSPTRSILKRSSSFENQNQNQLMRRPEFDAPVRDSGRIQNSTGRLTPGGRQAKGMIVAGGRSSSPAKSSMRRPPQVIKSSTMPETRGSGGRLVNVRTSSEDFRDSLNNSGPGYYGSDIGARNMTPDQMNIDALIQSGGYLSQSFSQSENGRYSAQSSLKSSGDVRQSRASASGRSLGYSYGTEGSISMSELQRLADDGTGRLQMSLTIPGTEADESELSEIDITDGGNTR